MALLFVRELGIGLAVGLAVGWLAVKGLRRARLAHRRPLSGRGRSAIAAIAYGAAATPARIGVPRRLPGRAGARQRAQSRPSAR